MKKIYLPVIALVAGIVNASLTVGIHSLFFIVLPLLAFALGYFHTWRLGLLYSFLLFAGYTFTISVIWLGVDSPNLFYPLPYITAFIAGGFGILLIGTLAPMVRKRIRSFGSLAAFIVLVMMISWCGYSAMPHYSYYYQVAIQSSENLEHLELYLPVGTVSGQTYEALYLQVLEMPGDITKDFTQEFVDTEYGRMLKLTIPKLNAEDVPHEISDDEDNKVLNVTNPELNNDDTIMPWYTANIIWMTSAPNEILHLMPKNDITAINEITSQQLSGPFTSHASRIVEEFNVPVKVASSTSGRIKLTLWNRTDRGETVNFTYSRSYPYTERISYVLETGGEWVIVPVEATITMDIRGISD